MSDQTVDTVSAKAPRARTPFVQRARLDRYSALYLLAVFLVIFTLLQPGVFLTWTTIRVTLAESVITAVLALAFLVPLAAGQFDLSIGVVMAFALVIVNWIGVETGIPPALGAVIALIACGIVGAVSGFIVVRLKVNSFIATLAVSQIITAAILQISGNLQITGAFSESYLNLGQSEVLGVPLLVIYLIVIASIVWFVMEQTPVGRALFATGGNTEAARLAGVRTDRVIWLSLVASALIAGISGILFSMKVGTFTSGVGPGYLFPAVAAVFLGASQFSKRPNVWGTIVAYIALAFGIKGLQLEAGTSSFWVQPLFEGVALVVAVAVAMRTSTVSNMRGASRRRFRRDDAATT